ncbi:MAG: hypothetical protein GPJ54_09455 [Candidatus Heimdallarchaeota archaeon]|nr:hypothetical protein [Candidatus Heimdallarchaeota archaeon]
MATSSFIILKGDTDTRNLLENAMTTDEEVDKQVRPILNNLDKLSEFHNEIAWWVAMLDDKPIGLLSAIYFEEQSQLLYTWVRPDMDDEFNDIVRTLANEWVEMSDQEIYYINMDPNSDLIEAIKSANFIFDQSILTVHEVNTQFSYVDIPDNLYLRKPEDNELAKIYDELIEPDLYKGSPIYITKNQFLHFAKNLPEISENWILCTDENDNLLGFGASFLQESLGTVAPVLYGPHTPSLDIAEILISEFLTYWKMNKQDEMRILRVDELDKYLKDKYNITKLNELSVNRYIYKKRLLDYFG